MSAYEAQRAANIARNAELLSSLGIQYAPVKPAATPSKPRPASKKRKAAPATPREPTRKSARLTTVEGGYTEPSGIDPEPDEPRGWLRQMPAVEIPDMDEVEYDPTFVAPAPTRDADGTLRFEKGYDHFTPNLVPRQIFKQGACACGQSLAAETCSRWDRVSTVLLSDRQASYRSRLRRVRLTRRSGRRARDV